MDEAALEVECPHCGAVFNVPDGPAGRQVNCPVCQGAVRVLDVEEGPPESAEVDQGQEPEPDQEPAAEDYFAARQAGAALGGDSGPCMVCCAHEEKLNMLVVRPLLMSYLGLAARNAAHQITHGMGILADGLSPDTAEALVDALKGKGIEAFAVSAGRAPEPVDEVKFLCVYDVDERGLHLQTDPKGTIRALRWEAVVAGVCTKDRFGDRRTVEYDLSPPYSYGAGPRALSITPHVKEQPAPTTLTLALHDGQGRLHTMKVTPEHVRYAYLGERLQGTHSFNFLVFLTDVGRHAQGAYFPPSYIQVAAGHEMALREPAGRVEYNNYLRWAVCCAARRGGLPGRTED